MDRDRGATAFLLSGSAQQTLQAAFQITLLGSVMFGLAQLLLVDHDGPVDRRDLFAIEAGLGEILCSGVGPTMVAVVGLAALPRRGWRVALMQTAPLAIAYLAWVATFHPPRRELSATPVTVIARWDAQSMAESFRQIGGTGSAGFLLAAVLVVGLFLSWRQRGTRAMLTTSAFTPLAMLVGILIFTTVTATQRADNFSGLYAERYVVISISLLLPAIASAADAIARAIPLHRLTAAPLVLLLAAGMSVNVSRYASAFPGAPFLDHTRLVAGSLPRLRDAAAVPRNVEVAPVFLFHVPMGWLRDQLKAGNLPGPFESSLPERRLLRTMVRLRQDPGAVDAPCRRLVRPIKLVLRPGHPLEIRDPVNVQAYFDGRLSPPLPWGPRWGQPAPQRIEAVGQPIRVLLSGLGPENPGEICGRLTQSASSRSHGANPHRTGDPIRKIVGS